MSLGSACSTSSSTCEAVLSPQPDGDGGAAAGAGGGAAASAGGAQAESSSLAARTAGGPSGAERVLPAGAPELTQVRRTPAARGATLPWLSRPGR